MERNTLFILLASIAVIVGVAFFMIPKGETVAFASSMKVYKGMSCGCCGNYVSYASQSGLKAEVETVENMDLIKQQYNIPSNLTSCHTSIIDGYFVEGHIPKEAIQKLLFEKPDIAGIALPGMPSGTPGMPGSKTEEWIVYAVNHDGTYKEFMKV